MTKNEFLDIMGGIDSRLIESTLDLTQSDDEFIRVERPIVLKPDERPRSYALKYVICAAACVAVVFAAAIFLINLKGVTVLPADDTTESVSDIFSDTMNESSSESEVTSSFEPEYFLDCVRVTPEYLEYTDQNIIKVTVELQDNLDSIQEAYDEEYANVEIDPINSPWTKFLSAAMKQYLSEFMEDHGIIYEELDSVRIFIPVFTGELDKDLITELLNDERVFVIYIPNEDSGPFVDF